jgi:hypothetical protein
VRHTSWSSAVYRSHCCIVTLGCDIFAPYEKKKKASDLSGAF